MQRSSLSRSSPRVACLADLNLYVAPDGSDTAPGTLQSPFATLARARDEIRRLKTRLPATVYVRGGVYEIPATLQLSAQDSGTAAAPIVYRAYQNEKRRSSPAPIASPASSPTKGKILKTDVGAQGMHGIYFRQLFYAGQRQQLARYPNYDRRQSLCRRLGLRRRQVRPHVHRHPRRGQAHPEIPGGRRAATGRIPKKPKSWSSPATTGGTTSSASSPSTATPAPSPSPATALMRFAPAIATSCATCSKSSMRPANGISTRPPTPFTSGLRTTIPTPPSMPRASAPSFSSTKAPSYVTFRGFTFEDFEGTAITLTDTDALPHRRQHHSQRWRLQRLGRQRQPRHGQRRRRQRHLSDRQPRYRRSAAATVRP